MKFLEKLKAAFAAVVVKMAALAEKAEAEDRVMTAEEKTEFDGFKAESDKLSSQVATQEAVVEAQAIVERNALTVAPVLPRQTSDATNLLDDPTKAAAAGGADPNAIQPIIIPARAMRMAGQLKAFVGATAHEDAYKAGMWYAAAVFGNANAAKWCTDHGFGIEASLGQNEGINIDGGYAVPEILETQIIRLVEAFGMFRRKARRWPMSSEVHSIPRRTGGLSATHTGEGQSATKGKISLDLVKLVAKKVTALAIMTKELNADNIIRFGDLITMEISLAFATREDADGFNGDGTSVFGGITGVVQTLFDLYGVTGGVGLVLGAGNQWSELTLANFNKVKGATANYEGQQNEEWYCSKTFKNEVMDNIKYAGGGNTVKDLSDGPGESFLGFPINISNSFPKTEENSQIPCIFGDLGLSSTFGDRSGMTMEMSGDASIDGVSLFQTGQMAILGTERYDIVNHDVGTADASGAISGIITAAS